MKILVAVDLPGASRAIIAYVKILASTCSGKVWLLHVAEPAPDFVGYEVDPIPMRNQTAKKYHEEHYQLQQLSQELCSAGINCTSLLIQGAIVETIINQANKLSIDMIIAGSHGKRVAMSLLLGSTSRDLLHKSSVPVLVIPLDGP
jgi:nucleotide-binding universal stress UspA family protein